MKTRLLSQAGVTGSPGRNADSFRPLEGEDWREIEELAPSQVYPAGIELFQQGFPAEDVYFINSGLVKLVYVDQSGRELILGLPSANGLAGASAAILKQPHQMTALTLTRCHLRRLPSSVFLELMRTNTLLSWKVHLRHCYELYQEVIQVAQFECLSVQDRVERLLWQLISSMDLKEVQKEIRFDLPLRYWEIAQLLAVTPEHLSRVLKRMGSEGMLRREKGRTVIVDRQRLRHAIGS